MPNMSVQKSNMPRQGVVKFTPEQLNNVVDAILSTANKMQQPRCGASFLLFMALRHTDNTNDDNLLKNLLVSSINGLKKMGKKNERTLPGITMWTCIAIRLTHLIFQYSGEPDACSLNTQVQNNHILKNFDINEFRSVFSETSITLYKKMITMIQDKIKPMVVSSMLDHDSLHGNTSGKSIEDLMRELGNNLDLIKEFGCDDIVLRQVLRQLIYFIVSISLNQLLVRRDLCNWTKAMQLRYNVSQIEEFLSRRNLREGPIIKELNPLVQSSQLMQVKKQDENDAKLLLQMCDSLTGAQVLKLLQLITPVHEYEEVVPARFLSIIKNKTSKNPGIQQRDVAHIFTPEFPYVPSDVVLTELELPHEVRKYAQLI
jgi:myosin-5